MRSSLLAACVLGIAATATAQDAPLAVGRFGGSTGPVAGARDAAVVGSVELDGRVYAELDHLLRAFPLHEEFHLRAGPDGYWRHDGIGGEVLWLDTSGTDAYTVTCDGHTYDVSVTHDHAISTPAGDVDRCKTFRFDIEPGATDGVFETYCDGVGLARVASLLTPTSSCTPSAPPRRRPRTPGPGPGAATDGPGPGAATAGPGPRSATDGPA